MSKTRTLFEQAGYTKDTKFKCLVNYRQLIKGDIVKLHNDDGTYCPEFINLNGDVNYMPLPIAGVNLQLEVYLEDPVVPKLKFPCCVPTSEIKDENTLRAVIDRFEASGAIVVDGVDVDGRVEFGRVANWEYFGVKELPSKALRTEMKRTDTYTIFYDCSDNEVTVHSTIFYDCSDNEVTVHSVAELLGTGKEEVIKVDPAEAPWIKWDCDAGQTAPVEKGTKLDIKWRSGEESLGITYGNGVACKTTCYTLNSWKDSSKSTVIAYRLHTPTVASQEAITDVSDSKSSVGITSGTSGYKEPTQTLVSVVKEVKYTVTIKGVDFTFTQDQVNELASELGGFVDYE